MARPLAAILLAALLLVPAHASAQNYVAGNFCTACQTPGPHNQLHDDGLHGDGAAGDLVFGADIVVDVAAGQYQWLVSRGPVFGFDASLPDCWCATPPSFAPLWTSGPGDVIHFALDLRSGNGWYPSLGVATDHAQPNPSPLEAAIGFPFDPRWEPPQMVVPASKVGSIWQAVALMPLAGTHRYAFRTADQSVLFAESYSSGCGGGCLPGENRADDFTTVAPDTYVLLQFDESVGRMRADVLGPTPARASTWGAIKALYR